MGFWGLNIDLILINQNQMGAVRALLTSGRLHRCEFLGLRLPAAITISIFLLAFVLQAVPAHAGHSDVMATLDEIQSIADKNNEEGLKRLIALNKNLPVETHPQMKLMVLRVISGLYFDAGKSKLGNESLEEFKLLARQLNDHDALMLIEVFDAYDIGEKTGVTAGLSYLENLRDKVKRFGNAEVKYRFAGTLANFYGNNGHFDEAMKQYFEMLNLCEQLPRRQLQARMSTWDAIASTYWAMKNPEKALEASTEALAISSENVAPKSFAQISITRGLALSELKRNEEALREYETALRIGRNEHLPFVVAHALSNLADQYLIMKDYRRAETTAREAMEQSTQLDDEWGAQNAKVNVGLAIAWQGKIKIGADLVQESIAFFKKNESMLDVEAIDKELAVVYESAGMYKEALALIREQQELADELFKTDRTKAVASLQEQFDTVQRKKQIELLAKENALKDADIKNHRLQQVVAFLATVLALLAGCFVYLMYLRSKRLNQQLQAMNSQLEFHAVRDPLTGLHNRRSFIDLMLNRIARVEVERRDGCYSNPDCMVLLDIDLFKHINDSYGHAVGDIVLKQVAQRLRDEVREHDMLMRWGGEEFLIFSPKSNPEQITNLVNRVLRTIGETPFMNGSQAIHVTVTAGFISVPFSEVPEDVCDWEKALQIADMALYLGKTHGRNRAYGLSKILVPYEEAIPILTHDLAEAIKQNMVDVIEVLGPVQAHH